jgi:hypothetical protein
LFLELIMRAVSKRCAVCQNEVTVTLERQNDAADEAWLEKSDAICFHCVRQSGQNPDSRYIVLQGAYYRQVVGGYARVGPVGAFHG